MDLQQLSMQQLSQVKKQLDEELEHLTSSFGKLRGAQSKFSDCAVSIRKGVPKADAEPKEVLVPLTASLYVPAKLATDGKVLVDVGTGFYMERSSADAEAFYKKKSEEIGKNMKDLEKIVQQKTNNLRAVEEVLRQKVIASGAGGGEGKTVAAA